MTIVGTVVGAYFGYPALGAVLGGLAGGLLFPAVLPTIQGPRLSDITQTSSNVGAPIPRGWGTFPATGNIIAQTDLREVIERDEVGGKGGPSQTTETATYFQDFAIGLNGSNIYGKGEIAGVRTIWANGKPIYDRRPQRTDETDEAFQKRLIASDQLESQFTLYLGTETQLPDPTLEAFYGVGNISAFRGLAYIVFNNWQNKAEDGNRMPSQWKFEVYTSGSQAFDAQTEFSNEVLYDWLRSGHPVNPKNRNVYVLPDTVTTTESLSEAVEAYRATRIPANMDWPIGWPSITWLDAQNIVSEGDGLDGYGVKLGGHSFNNQGSVRAQLFYGLEMEDIVIGVQALSDDPSARFTQAPGTIIYSQVGLGVTLSTVYLNPDPYPGDYYYPWDVLHGYPVEGTHYVLDSNPVTIQVDRFPVPPPDPCAGRADVSMLPGFCITGFGTLARRGDWTYDDSQQYLVLQSFVGTLDEYDSPTLYPLNPARPLSHPDNTEQFWTDAYKGAVISGKTAAGKVYVPGGGSDNDTEYPIQQAFAYRRDFQSSTISTGEVSMAHIVREICIEAGYDESDFNADDLESIIIIGYVRTRQMTARAALENMRTVGFWDLAEINGVLTFIRRGGPIVKTLRLDEMGAYSEGGEVPSLVTTRILQDMELPRQVRLHYIAPSRDYEPGEQPSPTRVETGAENDQDVEVAVVLTDDHAAQIAEVIHADAWASRWVHELQLDTANLGLVPSDVLGVPIDGRIERSRLVAITDSLPSLRKCELNRDDDGNYVSTAVGSTPPYQPGTPTVVGPFELILLDLPLLREQDNDSGFYAAMRSYLGDDTAGIGVYRSVDGGGTYTRIAQIGGSGVIATVITPLAVAPHTVWDQASELIIEMQSGEPENRTIAAVMAGANAAAVGVDGRWEVFQFTTQEHLTGNIFRLTNFLRGRRGTEHFIGTGIAGDRFVLLSTAGSNIARVPLSISGVHRSYLYKGVGSGAPIEGADVQNFTGEGVALKPFSPVQVEGSRNTINGDWTFTWVRRGRLGETLQSGIDVPLSEDFEDYEVDILSGTTVVRTISVSAQSATYLGTQQLIDFGSVQTMISIIVYQLSAQVGRGTGTEATL